MPPELPPSLVSFYTVVAGWLRFQVSLPLMRLVWNGIRPSRMITKVNQLGVPPRCIVSREWIIPTKNPPDTSSWFKLMESIARSDRSHFGCQAFMRLSDVLKILEWMTIRNTILLTTSAVLGSIISFQCSSCRSLSVLSMSPVFWLFLYPIQILAWLNCILGIDRDYLHTVWLSMHIWAVHVPMILPTLVKQRKYGSGQSWYTITPKLVRACRSWISPDSKIVLPWLSE